MAMRYKKIWLPVLVLAAFMVVVSLSGAWLSPRPARADNIKALAALKPGYGPVNYAAAIEAANQRLTLANERVARDPAQWPYQENLAYVHIAHYRLTGDYEHLMLAKSALDQGIKSAPKGSGPLLLRAALAVSRHDLPGVNADLAVYDGTAVPLSADEKSESIAISGDTDFYTGRYAASIQKYQSAAQVSENAGALFRMGRYYQKIGKPDLAIAKFVRAAQVQKDRTPQFLSSIWLQVGVIELERGNWDLAKTHFTRADKIFPGFWLTEAHLAQMLALDGDIKVAKQRYDQIIASSGSPEVMDALAALYRIEGNAVQSRTWSDRAGSIWTARLAQLPKAAYGHALDHELVFGDPVKALELARANYAARPHGDTAIMLGWALLANNKAPEARDLLEDLRASAWQSGQQYAALSEAYAMLNQAEKSEASREKALSINPKIFDPSAPMIWFGHH